tara:strand:- start:71 stop:271 length:201 start_codon:yes stop_codon:yes gene_type:complete
MTIKDILNIVKPASRLSAKNLATKRFKRRKGKDFHTKGDFDYKINISTVTNRMKGTLCDDINDDTE